MTLTLTIKILTKLNRGYRQKCHTSLFQIALAYLWPERLFCQSNDRGLFQLAVLQHTGCSGLISWLRGRISVHLPSSFDCLFFSHLPTPTSGRLVLLVFVSMQRMCWVVIKKPIGSHMTLTRLSSKIANSVVKTHIFFFMF